LLLAIAEYIAGKLFTYVRLSPTKRTLIQPEVGSSAAGAIDRHGPITAKKSIIALNPRAPFQLEKADAGSVRLSLCSLNGEINTP
jgi:hypothetical protein